MSYPTTPDGRYFVVRGRLWRTTDPSLDEDERQRLVDELMRLRRLIGRSKDEAAVAQARKDLHEVKVALGERGPPWWNDGAPDYNLQHASNTPYADWYTSLDMEHQRIR